MAPSHSAVALSRPAGQYTRTSASASLVSSNGCKQFVLKINGLNSVKKLGVLKPGSKYLASGYISKYSLMV